MADEKSGTKVDLQKIFNDVKTKITAVIGTLQKEIEKYTKKPDQPTKPKEPEKPKDSGT